MFLVFERVHSCMSGNKNFVTFPNCKVMWSSPLFTYRDQEFLSSRFFQNNPKIIKFKQFKNYLLNFGVFFHCLAHYGKSKIAEKQPLPSWHGSVVSGAEDIKMSNELLFLRILCKLGNTDKEVNNYNIACIIIETCTKPKVHIR